MRCAQGSRGIASRPPKSCGARTRRESIDRDPGARELRSALPCLSAKHRTGHEACAAQVITVENATNELSCREQTGHALAGRIQHGCSTIDPQTAERKGD